VVAANNFLISLNLLWRAINIVKGIPSCVLGVIINKQCLGSEVIWGEYNNALFH
jgi:hypothetical protein